MGGLQVAWQHLPSRTNNGAVTASLVTGTTWRAWTHRLLKAQAPHPSVLTGSPHGITAMGKTTKLQA